MIHPTAVIHPTAKIADNTTIGPFCIIEEDVVIAENCQLQSHSVIGKRTTMGSNNQVFPFSCIGTQSQDKKYRGATSRLQIGNDNVFREQVTIHKSTEADKPTSIGNHNHFLTLSHVAHDCTVGNHVVVSHCAGLAGHSIVEDYAVLSGYSGVHQFARIGQYGFLGGAAIATKDLPPYTILEKSGKIRGLNSIGLKRNNFSDSSIKALKSAYKLLFLDKQTELKIALETLESDRELMANKHVTHLLNFIKTSQRGVFR